MSNMKTSQVKYVKVNLKKTAIYVAMHVASYKVLAYCNKPKVGIKLDKLAILFQNTAACFLSFCSSGQSLATPFLN